MNIALKPTRLLLQKSNRNKWISNAASEKIFTATITTTARTITTGRRSFFSRRKKFVLLSSATLAVCAGTSLPTLIESSSDDKINLNKKNNESTKGSNRVRHTLFALQRIGVATKVGVQVAIDYKRTQSKRYSSNEERVVAIKHCHKRAAERVLAGLQKLGGIYVKLGQHVSAMTYILPLEWTTTLAVLQDRCDPTPPEDIRKLFLTDYGEPLEEVFDEFDWKPLGVASLAQVHKARLKQNRESHVSLSSSHNDGKNFALTDQQTGQRWVAVKFQHPRLDEFSRMDLETVSLIVGTIKQLFPDFGFEWILKEMQQSLPQEMDFEHEARNAYQVKKNFENENTPLVVPEILWAKRRILCMEFIDGARIDDLKYMKDHHIDPNQVSTEITKVFGKMMFLDGFVHCDPHPGNLLIRPTTTNNRNSKFKFDLVLLDHGLYRTLTDQLRTDYAHLWTSLIRGDEKGIETYSSKVGCRPGSYRLFASLLTGREWSTIQSADLSSFRTNTEMKRVSGRAKDFVSRIYDILATLPQIVLLLLKTSDLLRGLDETLRLEIGGDKYITYALMGRFCAEAVWLDAKQNLLRRIKEAPSLFHACKLFLSLFSSWWEYQTLEYGLWIYQLKVDVRTKWTMIWHHGVSVEEMQKQRQLKLIDTAAVVAPL
ncbi:ABC1 family-domain-containing protein [Mycotypha africana]|uniref:ABC1 family-domain-containing protein n=1 Tax=Mycotypha africana TaxID=64632 RepID=UPI0023017BA7|nr:ABC1 family-domain-containing protein [Mycotypha africana]KAI8968306.1 ABC1 family-domain-containing protein [Mycotypha africana]